MSTRSTVHAMRSTGLAVVLIAANAAFAQTAPAPAQAPRMAIVDVPGGKMKVLEPEAPANRGEPAYELVDTPGGRMKVMRGVETEKADVSVARAVAATTTKVGPNGARMRVRPGDPPIDPPVAKTTLPPGIRIVDITAQAAQTLFAPEPDVLYRVVPAQR